MDETWLLLIVVALVVNGILRWHVMREVRELDAKTSVVLSVLIVWAETWGESPEVVKRRLAEVLRR